MHALVVSEQGVSLHAEGELLVVKRGKHPLRRVRIKELEQVIVLGRIEVSSALLALLLRRNIDLVLLTQRGDFRGRLAGRASKNVQLRLAQYRRTTEPEFCLQVAQSIVGAKIRHQRQILLRAQRRLQDPDLAVALGSMRIAIRQVDSASHLDALRGIEGHAAATYFSQFHHLLRNEAFQFSGRNRRPPRDPVNALLSFGYAVLGSLLESEIYRCGLDPMLGCLHQPAFGRASLMLDLLEEFRPLVDGLVIRLINRRQLGPEDFTHHTAESLAEWLNDDPQGEVDRLAGSAEEVLTIGLPETDTTETPESAADKAVTGEPLDPPLVADDLSSKPIDTASPEPSLTNSPAVLLSDLGRRIFLNELFQRLRDKLYYPPRSASYELRGILREQTYHFARVVEAQEPHYRPFVPS